MTKKIKHKLNRLRKDGAAYFSQCNEDISTRNMHMLKAACALQLIMIVVYFIAAVFTFHSMKINLIYMTWVIFDTILALIVFRYDDKGIYSIKTVENLCWLFDACCMTFIIIISVYPLTDEPGVFFLIMNVFLPVLFILPLYKKLIFVTGSELVFFILAWLLKTENAFRFDSFFSITAWIFAIVAVFVSFSMRINDNLARIRTHYQTSIDILTGLPGKDSTDYLCRTYIKRMTVPVKCAVFLIDLDHLKLWNDMYGSHFGDYILHEFACQLRRIIYPADIVGRVGSDKFLVLFKDVKEQEMLGVKAEQINELARNIKLKDEDAHVTCSIGISVSDQKIPDYTELYEFADQALYRLSLEKEDSYKIVEIESSVLKIVNN